MNALAMRAERSVRRVAKPAAADASLRWRGAAVVLLGTSLLAAASAPAVAQQESTRSASAASASTAVPARTVRPSRVLTVARGAHVGFVTPDGQFACMLRTRLADYGPSCVVPFPKYKARVWNDMLRRWEAPQMLGFEGCRFVATYLSGLGDAIGAPAKQRAWWRPWMGTASMTSIYGAEGRRLAALPRGWTVSNGLSSCTSVRSGVTCRDLTRGRSFTASRRAWVVR